MQVRDVGGAALEMYDGNGLKYVFSSKGGTAGSRLDNGNLYMLTDIFGPGGSNVHVEYKFGAPALPALRVFPLISTLQIVRPVTGTPERAVDYVFKTIPRGRVSYEDGILGEEEGSRPLRPPRFAR